MHGEGMSCFEHGGHDEQRMPTYLDDTKQLIRVCRVTCVCGRARISAGQNISSDMEAEPSKRRK